MLKNLTAFFAIFALAACITMPFAFAATIITVTPATVAVKPTCIQTIDRFTINAGVPDGFETGEDTTARSAMINIGGVTYPGTEYIWTDPLTGEQWSVLDITLPPGTIFSGGPCAVTFVVPYDGGFITIVGIINDVNDPDTGDLMYYNICVTSVTHTP